MSTTEKALDIQGLEKTYAGGVKALKGINLQVEQGDFFALLGPNGAGKSTTIGIICSLVNKSSGTISVFGNDSVTQEVAAKSCIGLVPQEFNFNQFETLLQIVVNQAGYYGVPRKIAKIRAEKYLKQLELWDKRNANARELSGGMKRRLMIARALMHEPKMLILDEPTAGVDIEVRRSMWAFLKDINQQGVTIILTTHYLEEAEMLCRNIAIIDNGVIVENTSMKTLLSTLNLETFVFDLASGAKNINIPEFEHRAIDDQTLEVDVPKDSGLNVVFEEFSARKIKVMSMRNKANRLEELFVKLVKANNTPSTEPIAKGEPT
ncbi:Nod factor export ATP-binding protein I [Glaciecola punicea ACAM 611]|jgi:ABC-2 type transport system ATP-binding protein|uniref:Nod factor export ATP-binding protein I n=1 Tax=Glaciecola punicea ACAM 611 TaxID=1121923 RepID=H5TEP8_9ALTE|nr:ABC transporter ATP-binding protein [Glaciecola punicea]OFA32268.1 ABC transporter [Glaciecola punicea]GAB56775.1 Nod factor export ATP-binding protein I [Glaciecola punicea ACAM 611]